jgi:cobalt-zinc-cadmium efflux system outer membrane protein
MSKSAVRLGWIALGCCLPVLGAVCGAAEPDVLPAPSEQTASPRLTLERAVTWGLAYNPELAAIRQQRGVARAGLVIARTYPFNPNYETRVRHNSGPISAAITNRVSQEHSILLELEIRGQGNYRRQEAMATMSRTDWEIASQELGHALAIVRAFDTAVYRQEKLRLLNDTITLDRQIADQTARLVEAGKLRSADLIVARTEIDDAIAQAGPGRTALIGALYDLRRAMGTVDEPIELDGTLTRPLPGYDEGDLVNAALERRPDRALRRAAVAEAEARVRLAIANRYGNPTLGPTYEMDPTRVSLLGATLTIPLPALNTHQGEIWQRQAERSRAELELRQTEIGIAQDVHAALARLAAARNRVSVYQTQVLPHLQASFKDMEQLFLQGDPGVDALRVIDVRRKLLRARDGFLDAIFELDQAQADLAAAVGDPSLAYVADPEPEHP